MIRLDGATVFSLKFDGEEFPFVQDALQEFRIIDSMQKIATVIEIIIKDRGNNLLEMLPLTGKEVVTVGFGRDNQEYEEQDFSVVSFPTENLTSNSPEGSLIKLVLISKRAEILFDSVQTHWWKGICISDVLLDICKKTGMDIGRIEKTKGIGNWFMPKWTYAQYIRYLAQIAVSNDFGVAGFLYYANFFGELSFCSYDSLYSQTLDEENRKYSQTLERDGESTTKQIFDVQMKNNYMNVLMQGGIGVYAPIFDYEKSVFSINEVTIETIKHGALTNWLLAEEENVGAKRMINSVRKDGSIAYEDTARAQSYVLQRLNAVVSMSVLVRGDSSLRTGEKVNVVLPSTSKEMIYNELYSGDWIVGGLCHYYSIRAGFVLFTRMELFRNGLDITGIDGLVKPKGRVYV
jgi:hypothetical protein